MYIVYPYILQMSNKNRREDHGGLLAFRFDLLGNLLGFHFVNTFADVVLDRLPLNLLEEGNDTDRNPGCHIEREGKEEEYLSGGGCIDGAPFGSNGYQTHHKEGEVSADNGACAHNYICPDHGIVVYDMYGC